MSTGKQDCRAPSGAANFAITKLIACFKVFLPFLFNLWNFKKLNHWNFGWVLNWAIEAKTVFGLYCPLFVFARSSANDYMVSHSCLLLIYTQFQNPKIMSKMFISSLHNGISPNNRWCHYSFSELTYEELQFLALLYSTLQPQRLIGKYWSKCEPCGF